MGDGIIPRPFYNINIERPVMAHPKRKTSKSVKNMRRSHLALKAVSLGTCPSCNAPKPYHRVCGSCGYYDKERSIAI